MERWTDGRDLGPSSSEDLACPASLPSGKVMLLGPSQSGKSTLAQCLLEGSSPSSSFSSSSTSSSSSSTSSSTSSSPPRADDEHRPTDRVRVHLWAPSVTQAMERTVAQDSQGGDQRLILELWDTPGRQVCQPVHGLFLTSRTLCIIVFDVTDTEAPDNATALYRMIRDKCPDSPVVVVGSKADLVHPEDRRAAQSMDKVLHALGRHQQSYRDHMSQHIEDTRALLKKHHQAKDKDTDQEKGKEKSKPHQIGAENALLTDESAHGTPLQQHLTYLQDRLSRATSTQNTLRSVIVSGISGKGINDFRRIVLEAVADVGSFPHSSSSSSSTKRQSTASLYDKLLALRDRDVVMLPWRQLAEAVMEQEGEGGGGGDGISEASLEEDVMYLSHVGAVTEFRVGQISFPSEPAHVPKAAGEKQEKENMEEKETWRDHSGPLLTHVLEPRVHKPTAVAGEERYVCVHPAVFATAICRCLLDDDRTSFRFEAGRFWPRDSGFKHPDPQVLCKVLEAIPQQGLLRECLLPLLWQVAKSSVSCYVMTQEHVLSEEQILHMLHVLQGQGLLAGLCQQKKHCEGLALPSFPRLSVHRCHALPLLSLLTDNRPQLNWTPKPFEGDIQVTWSFHMHAHTRLLQRLLAVTLFLSRGCSSYRHLWRYGVLLRVGEQSTICAEMPESEDRLSVSCRVNGDELGRERDAMRMLWTTVTPFLFHLRHFLLRFWPGLLFKETVLAWGQQLYQGEKLEGEEPEVPVPAALSLWLQRRTCLTLVEGDKTLSLDLALLFPFPPDPSARDGDGWLKLVMSNTDVILSDASVNVTSSLPSQTRGKNYKRRGLKNSVRHHRKKKGVEIKWHLQEENSNNNNSNKTNNEPNSSAASEISDPIGNKELQAAADPTTLPTDLTNQVTGSHTITDQDVEAEAMRLASGFVAAILASAVADYVAQEAEGDRNGRKLISAAQITAARFTAEAAMAVHAGHIEGAAHAVIDAVNAAVKNHNSASKKVENTNRHKSLVSGSKLCVIA